MINRKLLLLLLICTTAQMIFAGGDGRQTKAQEIAREAAERQRRDEQKATEVARKIELCIAYQFKYNATNNVYEFRIDSHETTTYVPATDQFFIQRNLWKNGSETPTTETTATDFDAFIIRLETRPY